MILDPVAGRVRGIRTILARAAVQNLGVPPARAGYRWLRSETVPDYFARVAPADGDPRHRYTRVHPEAVFRNPLPRTIGSREQLPDDAGWWGYSMRDVPARRAEETFLATLPGCRVVHYRRPSDDQFYPMIVNRDDRALLLREIRFRPEMAPLLASRRRVRMDRATWILERSFHNHSHWLTAHLPKIVLLRSRGELDDVIMPDKSTGVIDASLRMLGLNQRDFRALEPDVVLEAETLTLMGTDRFRPELLRSVHAAFHSPGSRSPWRRVFISRAKATRRRLVNEEEIWGILAPYGFERVFMEELSFEAQVELMGETAILFALHGAGLTNMIFCPPGTHVVEIADLSFPNPNFYALASALEHPYWLLSGTPQGDEHPLHRDVAMDPRPVRAMLPELLAAVGS